MNIRPAVFDDIPAILAISNRAAEVSPANFALQPESLESWQTQWRNTSASHPWFVACDGERIIGFTRAVPWKSRGAYNWTAEVSVYIDSDYLGRGIGRTLYEMLIRTMERQGWRTLFGGITLPNLASVRLHESFGFRKVGVFERSGYKFNQWHDVGYWTLHLGDPASPPAALRTVAEAIESLQAQREE